MTDDGEASPPPPDPLGEHDWAGFWLAEAVRLVESGDGSRRLLVAVQMARLEYLRAGVQVQADRQLGGDSCAESDPEGLS